MKKSNSTKKALGAFKKLGVVALITATMFFTACNQAGGGGGEKPTPTPTPTPTKYTVTLTQTANGNVTASPAIPTDKQVAKDTIITFTATANDGYKIGKWTVTGSALEANTGADGSKTAKVKITANTTVSVSFEANSNPPNPPTPTKYTVTLTQTANGTVTPSSAIPQEGVDKDTEITFTATAESGYRVNTWAVTPNEAIQSGGKKGETTATLKITANTTVSVSFEEIPKHAINFNVDSNTPNGTLKAKADGVDETSTGPINVEEDKTVTFTATAESGYRVKEWKVGDTVVANNKTNTYKHPVTEPATITVSFERIPDGAILTLAADKNVVGVWAKTEDGTDITVVGCTETTLTSENQRDLTANENGAKITLKGNIIELSVAYQPTIKGPLTALDVSGLAKLQKLKCGDNQLTSLNASGLTALNEISCYSNNLTELNVQGCTALQKLECSGNDLLELNVKGLIALQELSCPNNKLTKLDVRGLAVLKNLRCNENKLTSLNVKGLTALEELDCRVNNLTELKVQGLTKLQNLDCDENQLKTLDASNLTELKNLNCNENQLTELKVQGCTALKNLYCHSNQLGIKAMTELLKGLPQREANQDPPAVALLYTEETGKTEGNYKDFNTTATDATSVNLKTAFQGAKSRNWKLRKVNEGGWDYVDI